MKILDLSDCDISDQGLTAICRCAQLQKLDLNANKQSRTNVTSEGIEIHLFICFLFSFILILGLDFMSRFHCNNHHFNRFFLYTSDSYVPVNSGICRLARSCSHLQTLYLRRCLNLTDVAIETIATSCPQLRYLNIGGCTNITDSALLALGEKTKFLKSLNVSNTQASSTCTTLILWFGLTGVSFMVKEFYLLISYCN